MAESTRNPPPQMEETMPSEVEVEDEVEDEVEMESMLQHLAGKVTKESIPLRVHDIIIKGNTKTKENVIEAEIVDVLKGAVSLQEIFHAAAVADAKLRALGIFDDVHLRLDPGPLELPATTNVVVQVVEANSPLDAKLGFFTRPGAKSWTLEGSLNLKNLFGYADLWDGTALYGLDHTSEFSAGVALPRISRWASPLFARASLLSQDWQAFSSYKEQALGIGLGLLSTKNHQLMYNLSWRTLTDPSQMAGASVRRQLGHSLLSSLKYTFKVDKRNSTLRPTRGYAFSFSTLLAGLSPDSRSAQFLRQEVDLRYALPLGFYRSALNFGISAGVIFPWGKDFLDRPSSLTDRFFMGGSLSPFCSMAGPTLLGFKTRGLGPTEPRRQTREQADGASFERDALGGDLAVSAFADLSFDLPLKVLKDAGIHGHVFAAAGNLTKLTENEWRNFSAKRFLETSRSTVGCGIIVPTKLFRMEVNYCHIVKQFEHDHGKTGLQFSFSSPF